MPPARHDGRQGAQRPHLTLFSVPPLLYSLHCRIPSPSHSTSNNHLALHARRRPTLRLLDSRSAPGLPPNRSRNREPSPPVISRRRRQNRPQRRAPRLLVCRPRLRRETSSSWASSTTTRPKRASPTPSASYRPATIARAASGNSTKTLTPPSEATPALGRLLRRLREGERRGAVGGACGRSETALGGWSFSRLPRPCRRMAARSSSSASCRSAVRTTSPPRTALPTEADER